MRAKRLRVLNAWWNEVYPEKPATRAILRFMDSGLSPQQALSALVQRMGHEPGEYTMAAGGRILRVVEPAAAAVSNRQQLKQLSKSKQRRLQKDRKRMAYGRRKEPSMQGLAAHAAANRRAAAVMSGTKASDDADTK